MPAGANTEACVFLRLPAQKPFELASWDIRTRSSGAGLGALHFLVYVYTGERLAEFAKDAGHIVPSRGCLDLGPVDRDRRQLVASGFARTRGALPQGVAMSLNPVPAVPGGPLNVIDKCTYANGAAYRFTYGDWGIISRIDKLSSTGLVRSYISYNFPPASQAARPANAWRVTSAWMASL